MNRRPCVLDLFAGYGGLGLAVEEVTGLRVGWFAETDPGACAVLAHRFPGIKNLGDVTQIDYASLADDVAVISAGFPCQDISNAGARKGISGERSGLWKQVVEAVRVIRPGLVFLENVAAIRSRGLGVVAEDMAAIGYDVRWTCLRASDVGAAHHRDRWFAVAHLNGARLEIGRVESAWEERAASERSSKAPQDADESARVERLRAASREAQGGGHGPTLDDEVSFLLPYSDSVGRDGRCGHVSESEGRDEPAHGGHSPAEWWGEFLPAVHRHEQLTGRPAPEPTETGPKGGIRLHAPFAEWLMGLDAGHVTGTPGLSRKDQLRSIGNGVMPQQAVAAFRELLSWTE